MFVCFDFSQTLYRTSQVISSMFSKFQGLPNIFVFLMNFSKLKKTRKITEEFAKNSKFWQTLILRNLARNHIEKFYISFEKIQPYKLYCMWFSKFEKFSIFTVKSLAVGTWRRVRQHSSSV